MQAPIASNRITASYKPKAHEGITGGYGIVLQAGFALLLVGIPLLFGACRRADTADGRAVWSDPTGDVRSVANLPDRPAPDLDEVAVGSTNGQLLVELNLKNLRKRLEYTGADKKRHGVSLLDLLLDTDLNPTTGGAPISLWPSSDVRPARFGYEFRIAVLAGFRTQSADGGSGSTVGDVSIETDKYVKIEPVIKYQIWTLGNKRFDGKHVALSDADSAILDTELAVLDNDRVRLRIPCNYLGIKSGSKVRIAYLDVQEGASAESSLSTDQILTLR